MSRGAAARQKAADRRCAVTASHYVEGVVLCALFIACVAGASYAYGRGCGAWVGAPARLAEVVIGISIVVLVSEALGSIGLFRVFPLSERWLHSLFCSCCGRGRAGAPNHNAWRDTARLGIAPSRTEAKGNRLLPSWRAASSLPNGAPAPFSHFEMA